MTKNLNKYITLDLKISIALYTIVTTIYIFNLFNNLFIGSIVSIAYSLFILGACYCFKNDIHILSMYTLLFVSYFIKASIIYYLLSFIFIHS